MNSYPSTIIVRHRRENLKKCSLRGLEKRTDCKFYRYPNLQLPPAAGYIVLALDAPVLTMDDADKGLLLLDATWRYSGKMLKWASKIPALIYRSLPDNLRTAYPRRQDDCSDPEKGLASVEALYAAYRILDRPTEGLFDHYHWGSNFVELNYPS
ncbi:MAG: hypothetical protein WC222_12160 [Parachlamydiales bacterium]|jgi:pre-rRNA-processing protein TSR3